MEYDFRSRFHLPLKTFGREVEWGEAIRLIRILREDPSSQFAASIEDWSRPMSREAWMMADLIDIQGYSTAGKKWKPYPRPSDVTPKRVGRTDGRSRAEVLAILGRAAEVRG